MTDRLLDSNAISAVMQCDPEMEEFLRELDAADQLVTSAVVEGEIRFGVARLGEGRRKQILAEALDKTLDRLHGVLPVDNNTALLYAELKADLWSRGLPIGENDLWIAATALQHTMILVTRHVHFKSIVGLQLQDWSLPASVPSAGLEP